MYQSPSFFLRRIRSRSQISWKRLGNEKPVKDLWPCLISTGGFYYASRIWKRRFHSENPSNVFNATITGHFRFVLQENSAGQVNHIITVMSPFPESFVFKLLSAKPTSSNSYDLKSVFEKLRFRDALVWTAGLTVEIKLRFQIPPAGVAYIISCSIGETLITYM